MVPYLLHYWIWALVAAAEREEQCPADFGDENDDYHGLIFGTIFAPIFLAPLCCALGFLMVRSERKRRHEADADYNRRMQDVAARTNGASARVETTQPVEKEVVYVNKTDKIGSSRGSDTAGEYTTHKEEPVVQREQVIVARSDNAASRVAVRDKRK